MKNLVVAILCVFLSSCVSSPRPRVPEKPSGMSAEELRGDIEKISFELLSMIPRAKGGSGGAYRSVCGTVEFDDLALPLYEKFWDMLAAVRSMEELVGKAGKALPARESKAYKAVLSDVRFSCPDVDTICESKSAEFGCYDVLVSLIKAARVYAHALSKLAP